MSTIPILPHLDFRCRIVHEVSADFFRTPTPWGAGATSGALGVDTYSRAAGPTIEVPLRSCNKQCEILAHHSVQAAESNWPPIDGSKFP